MSRPLIALALAAFSLAATGCRAEPARGGAPARVEHRERVGPPAAAPSAPARPRRDLAGDEARGGHTLRKHVGKTDDELRERLARERGVSAASTYTDRDAAEEVVASTLAGAGRRLSEWLAREGRRPNLALDYRGDRVIGRSLRRGARAVEPCRGAVVVLRWEPRAGDFYVLTSYPEAR